MRNIFIGSGLIAGNFLCHFFGDVSLETAIDRSFFQGIAILAVVLSDMARPKAAE